MPTSEILMAVSQRVHGGKQHLVMGTRSPGHSGKEASEYAADHLWTSIYSVPCERRWF